MAQHFIREWRNERGLSQEALAERIGIDRGYLSKIESGKRKYDQPFLEAAAEALRCTPSDLIRRGPHDPEAIETKGLAPDQVALVQGMVEQLRRTGTGG